MKIQSLAIVTKLGAWFSVLLACSFGFITSAAHAGPDDIIARPKFHQRYKYIGVQTEMPERERLQVSQALYEVDDALARVLADPAKNSGGVYVLDPTHRHFRTHENGSLFEGMYMLEMAPKFILALKGHAAEPTVRESIGTASNHFSRSLVWYMDLYRIAPDWESRDYQRNDVNFLLRHSEDRKESSYEFNMENRTFGALLEFNRALLEIGAVSSAVTLAEHWNTVADTKNFKFSPLLQITVAKMRMAILRSSLASGLDLQSVRAGVAALKNLEVPMRAAQGWQLEAGANNDAAAEGTRAVWGGTSIARLMVLRLEIISEIEKAKLQIENGGGTISDRDRVEMKRVFAREYSISTSERRIVEHSKTDLALRSLSVRICREMFTATAGN
jgi:hypothetical protein